MRITIITIGDEILVGQVLDSNSARIAQILIPQGFKVERKWTVADKKEDIFYAMSEASKISDLVLMTGGLGPTKDDITKKTMADFFAIPLVFSDIAYAHLEKIVLPRGIQITETLKSQCYVPEKAELLDNQMGTALGICLSAKNCLWVSMPGVPYEMEYIMQHSVIPKIQNLHSGLKLENFTIHFCGLGETEIADRLESKLEALSNQFSLAYLPSLGIVKLRITKTEQAEKDLFSKVQDIAVAEFGHRIFGYGDTYLEKEIGIKLLANQLQLSTAESCTGGGVAQRITSIPGSSKYFKGSIIAYDNQVKIDLLNVNTETLQEFGAVSEDCLEQMIRGGNALLKTQLCIATTGIAGPDGATETKPVGLIWVGVGSAEAIRTKKLKLSRDRTRNNEAAIAWSLILLWDYLHETAINH